MPCCKISDCAQMSKTIIAVRHFGLGGRESLETAVTTYYIDMQRLEILITNFPKDNVQKCSFRNSKTPSRVKAYNKRVHIYF